MKIPITQNYNDSKVIGSLELKEDVAIDWLKMGFAVAISLQDGKVFLKGVTIIPRSLRINTELEIVNGKCLAWKDAMRKRRRMNIFVKILLTIIICAIQFGIGYAVCLIWIIKYKGAG